MAYQGYVKVIDANQNTLDVAEATLGPIDHPGHSWGGTLLVGAGGALDGKTMPVDLMVPDLFRAPALLVPGARTSPRREMTVLGSGPNPF